MEKLRKEISDEFKWNLTDLIKDDEEYQNLVAEAKTLEGKITGMKGLITTSKENLYCFLETDSKLNFVLEKIYVYSNLYHYMDMNDEIGLNYKSTAQSLLDELSVKLSFTNSELMSLGYEKIKEYIKENKDLEKYAFYLEKKFRYEKHVLNENEEKIIAEATKAFGTPDDVFSALDNVDIDLGFIKDENGQKVKLNNSNYIRYMSSENRAVRKNAFKNMYAYFKSHINTIAANYLGCIKEDYFHSSVRKFKSSLERNLYDDFITEEFYHTFIENVHRYIPMLQRYLKLRSKALGYKNHMYDIYTDLISAKSKDIPYEEGVMHVKAALKPLGSKYLSDLEKAFTDGWVDIYPNKYKRSGAYQWGAYGSHPYVSLNYENDFDSVSTLAHELGHAMHSYYSDASNDYIDAGYPIFLAEIASTVNEALIDDYFYKNATNDDEKILYLQNFLDKVRTTIFRQTMLAEFEFIMHDKYQKNETITQKELCDTYYELNKKYFGKSIVIDEEIKYEWARIPHFYTPFYVYQYATGLISALSIASDILNDVPGAKENYMKFLSSGGSDYPLNILKNVSVDISDTSVIKKAFDLFQEKLDQLEELIQKKEEENEQKRLLRNTRS